MKQHNFHLLPILIIILWVVCGIVPLVAGYIKKRITIGLIGFISSVIGSLFFGLILGLPLSLIFTLVIILMKPRSDNNVFNAPPNPPKFNE